MKIVFPLSKGGFISGFMLIFVSIMKELDLIILIMTPTTSTPPYLACSGTRTATRRRHLTCVAIVMFSIVFLVYAIAESTPARRTWPKHGRLDADRELRGDDEHEQD